MIEGFDESVSRELERWLGGAMPPGLNARPIAIFDADGTLWRGDIGEAFFQHQLEQGTIPGAPENEPWKTYLTEVLQGNTVEAYGNLARWNAGVRERDLVASCERYFRDSWAQLVFKPLRELLRRMAAAGIEVWVVTASPRWIVQAGAAALGIAPERVIGASVVVEHGVLTDRLEHEVPYRAGKARLIAHKIGISPVFVAGNTYWDKEMMAMSTGPALAVHSEHEGEMNYESEQKLQKLAAEKGWLRQKF